MECIPLDQAKTDAACSRRLLQQGAVLRGACSLRFNSNSKPHAMRAYYLSYPGLLGDGVWHRVNKDVGLTRCDHLERCIIRTTIYIKLIQITMIFPRRVF